jgi:hypothetical protein
MAESATNHLMGCTRGLFNPEYPIGHKVRIKPLPFLREFRRNWRWHHPLRVYQLLFAGRMAAVKKVGFYFGGEELYHLRGIPGIWHETCLVGHDTNS